MFPGLKTVTPEGDRGGPGFGQVGALGFLPDFFERGRAIESENKNPRPYVSDFEPLRFEPSALR